MAVYEDEKTKDNDLVPNDDSLRRLTGINSDQEGAMNRQAHNGAAEDIAQREGLKAPLSDENADPKTPTLDNLNSAEQNAGNASSGGGGNISANFGGGFWKAGAAATSVAGSAGLANFFLGSRFRKRATVGGGIAGGLTGLAIFGLTIVSGPAQLVHLSQILQRDFTGSNNSSENRLNKLFRYARSNATGDVGETRVGILGSKIFGSTIKQLSDVGITFERSSLTGNPKSMTIDPDKLSKAFPELDGMSAADQQTFLAEKFGISADQLSLNSDGLLEVGTRDIGISATRALVGNAMSALSDGKIVNAIKFREVAKFFNIPSLFHPLEKAKAAAQNKAGAALDDKAAEQAREQTIEAPAEAEAAPIETDVGGKLSGVKKTASGLLLFTSAACLVRSVADSVVALNHAAIVVPSAAQAVDKIAVGSQVQSGQDIDIGQAGAVEQSFTDSNGQTIWQGQALQATASNGINPPGQDLPLDYKQGFSNQTTAQTLKDTLGLGGFGAVACSGPGIILQIIGSVGLAISGVFDEGGSWAALAASEGTKVAATSGAMYMLQHQLTKILADKAIVPTVFSGALGGNLLAYGAREAGNIGAVSSGGIDLGSSTQNTTLSAAEQNQDEQQFRSESFFARIFDVNDYRSLAGHLADSISPSFSQNVGSIFGKLGDIVGSIPHIFSLLLPGAHAASQPYDWGFDQFGIPDSVLNNPNMEDPYANAGTVAKLLDKTGGANSPYIGRAKQCFGVAIAKIDGIWDVTAQTDVDTNSAAYLGANCADTSNTNWDRMILFVNDTQTMEAAACYQGDTQSCNQFGA